MEQTDRQAADSRITIASLAKRFGLAESTARFYCKTFIAYLPHEGAGKRRRYHPEAVEVFGEIVDAMKRLKNSALVAADLDKKFERIIPENEDVAAEYTVNVGAGKGFTALLEQQATVLRDISDSLKSLHTVQKPVAVKEQEVESGDATVSVSTMPDDMFARLEACEEALEKIGTRVESLSKLIDDAERMHHQDMEQLRKWLSELARRQQEM